MPSLPTATEEERAGEPGIVKDPQRPRVVELSPEGLALGGARSRAPRELEALLAKGPHRAGRRARAAERVEEGAERLLHLLVRIKDDANIGVVDEADG